MKKAILFILSLIIYVFLSIPLAILFEGLQNYLFHSSNTILFMHSKFTNGIIASGLIVCLGLFWIIHNRRTKPKKYIIVVIVFIATFLVAFVDVFSYTVISDGGIITRKNIFENKQNYSWSNVQSANIDYKYYKNRRGEKKVIFEYYLLFDDGTKLFFRNSEEFRSYSKVMSITQFLQAKGIKIIKADLTEEDLNLLVSNYNDEYGEVTEIMFRQLYNIDY